VYPPVLVSPARGADASLYALYQAYELSTLTGTQVLLLVVSETGLVYTFTTAKLQPLVTQPEGKNLIQACLNAPHGQLPSQMPVGSTISRSGAPGPQPMATAAQTNVSGGLTIGSGGQKDEDAERDESDRANKRRRRGSGAAQQTNPPPSNNSTANNRAAPPQSPHSPNAPIPAPAPPSMNIPGQRSGAPPQMTMGSPPQSHTHPHPTHQAPQNTYTHQPYPGQPQTDLYTGQPMMGPAGYGYTQPQGGQGPPQNSLQQGGQQWAQAVPQNSHYTRR